MVDTRESMQSPPPDDGGHLGSFTRPADDMMVETTGQSDPGHRGGPPLHTDPAANETTTPEGMRGFLIGLFLLAVTVTVALLGLIPCGSESNAASTRPQERPTDRSAS